MKSLLNRIGRGARKTAILALTLPFFYGCPEPAPEPEEENYPPTALFRVIPTYGKEPLDVNITLYGNDGNGVADIKEYRITIKGGIGEGVDETIIQSSPIEINRTYRIKTATTMHAISISGKCTDSKGKSGSRSEGVIVTRN